MKNLTLMAVIIVLLTCLYRLYFALAPEVRVENLSKQHIEAVEVLLPSSKLRFDSVPTQTEARLYYSLNQADGSYHYRITVQAGNILEGECGYLTANEIGKLMILTLTKEGNVSCTEF